MDWTEAPPRALSMVVHLDSSKVDYTGGEFWVAATGTTSVVPFHSGDVVVFPADQLWHKVDKIKQGVRRTISFWISYDAKLTHDYDDVHDAALSSSRIKLSAAEINDRAPKDKHDTWDQWVFDDVGLEEDEFFAGKILRLEKGKLVIVEIKKIIGKVEVTILLDDFIKGVEAGVYEWLGNDGAAAEEAIGRYKAWWGE